MTYINELFIYLIVCLPVGAKSCSLDVGIYGSVTNGLQDKWTTFETDHRTNGPYTNWTARGMDHMTSGPQEDLIEFCYRWSSQTCHTSSQGLINTRQLKKISEKCYTFS